MIAVKHTHTHTHCCSSLPDRKCGSEHNVTSHNLTFTTCRRCHSHTRVQMQKQHLQHETVCRWPIWGRNVGLCLTLVPVRLWISLSASCQSCRQAGYVGLKRESHWEQHILLTENHLVSASIPAALQRSKCTHLSYTGKINSGAWQC